MIGVLNYKIILMGDPNVGKTTLRNSFMGERISGKYEKTIGVEISEKKIQIRPDLYARLLIYDIAGQKQFEYLHDLFFAGSHGALAVFDVTNVESFRRTILWVLRYWRVLNCYRPVILIANKIDLEESRVISRENIEQLALKFSEKCSCEVPFYETSALNGINVEKSFYRLIKMIIEESNNIEIEYRLET